VVNVSPGLRKTWKVVYVQVIRNSCTAVLCTCEVASLLIQIMCVTHKYNLANNIGGTKLTMGIRDFILQRSKI
jgi:hypothetical protein